VDLRLIVITDRKLAQPRSVEEVVRLALAAGAPAIQLRDKSASSGELLQQAEALLPLVRSHGALLFINDRVDVALLCGADGVHLGPDDLPVRDARRIAPHLLIGYSTDDPEQAREAERDGASYIGCGAVFGTTSKSDAANERIGPEQLDAVARAVNIPVVGIGGITPDNVAQVGATRAAGVAVIGAVMASPDPAQATRVLLDGFASGRRA
jgi:thiamine-phosphate pyrophosphorylase